MINRILTAALQHSEGLANLSLPLKVLVPHKLSLGGASKR
jgi:hypothetical protein